MQTAYTGLKPLQQNVYSYLGGFCKWWYIPFEDVAIFPRINAANQYLTGEPVLKAGKSWFGPIAVPRDQFGYTENLKRVKAGHYYETKIEGVHIGDSPESRINLQNMPFHDYLVVGKVRAGGFYKLFGTPDSPLEFNPAYKSGNGPADTAQTTLAFITEQIDKAFVLPSFIGDVTAPENGGTGPGGSDSMANQKEIIPFNAGVITSIPWTATRLNKFGTMPLVEVYLQEPGELPYLSVGGSIEIDAPPPAFTEMTIKPGANLPGFIVIG